MQDLEYLIQVLKFCEKELTIVCGERNPLEGIDCYALKCTYVQTDITICKN